MNWDCYWKDLNEAAEPGKVNVAHVGIVNVTKENIDEAKKIGGNILVVLKKKRFSGAFSFSQLPQEEFEIESMKSVPEDHQRNFFAW